MILERVLRRKFIRKCSKTYFRVTIFISRECYCKLEVNQNLVGTYKLDFLIEGRVVVEFKARDQVYKKDISQILNYLKIKQVKVGLLANFTNNGVKIKRLVY